MIDGSQPTFPETHIHHFMTKGESGQDQSAVVPRWMGGLTKREYFAAMAVQGLLVHIGWAKEARMDFHTYVAEQALSVADALIAQLGKERK